MSAILEMKDVNELGLSYSPLHPTIGAEVEGVDLSQPISDEVRDDIRRSWGCLTPRIVKCCS